MEVGLGLQTRLGLELLVERLDAHAILTELLHQPSNLVFSFAVYSIFSFTSHDFLFSVTTAVICFECDVWVL